MKRVTKFFQTDVTTSIVSVDFIVNRKLQSRLHVSVGRMRSVLRQDDGAFICSCETPKALVHALETNEPISFSVTLPGLFWHH